MLKGMALLIGVLIVFAGCATVREFDAENGVFKKNKKTIPCWKVDERDEALIKALEENGKLKIEIVKERNKWISVILNVGMGFGLFVVFAGIVWSLYNVLYLAGQYAKSGLLCIGSGVTMYLSCYLLSEHMWIIMTIFGMFTLGFIGWLVWFLKNEREKAEVAVNTVEAAKAGVEGEGMKNTLRSIQGKHQAFFSKIKDKYVK